MPLLRKSKIYPVLPLWEMVMFPKMILTIFVGRKRSINAVKHAEALEGQMILLITQLDKDVEDVTSSDLYGFGVVAKILQVVKLQNSSIKILVEGLSRVKVTKFSNNENFISAYVKELQDILPSVGEESKKAEMVVMQRTIIEMFSEYSNKMHGEILNTLTKLSYSEMCDAISANMSMSVEVKQDLLSDIDVYSRMKKIILFMQKEIEFQKLESKMKGDLSKKITNSQREYYLREKLKIIHKELGEDDPNAEYDELYQKSKKKKLSAEARKKVETELKKLKSTNIVSAESNIIKSYLDYFLSLPWDHAKPLKQNMREAERLLDNDHYGLIEPKERIIEYIGVTMRKNAKEIGTVICFVGPPGVGKTSLAHSIAKVTGRSFVKVSLGGVRDEAEIRGHRRTYVGAMPGKIIQGMKKAQCSNPVMLLDEIDKLGSDFRGDPSSALLEVLDPGQNATFNDHYLEVPYDLSKVMFIATANTLQMPKPLLDRLEIINVSSYTAEEKLEIAMKHLVNKQMSANGLNQSEIAINESTIAALIKHYTREAGVRELSRKIGLLMRKALRKILCSDGAIKSLNIDAKDLQGMIGPYDFVDDEIDKYDRVGICNGLAYTEVGGQLLPIEIVIVQGKGEIKITGKIGEVMKESALAALSYVRSRAAEIGIEHIDFKTVDVHIHVPEGAIPKDGPSAGIAICTALVSAATSIPVRRDIAMTGEISLRGRVLGIGGLKEKLLSALRAGVVKVFIPQANAKDLVKIPDKVKKDLEIIPIDEVMSVLCGALSINMHNKPDNEKSLSLIQKISLDTKNNNVDPIVAQSDCFGQDDLKHINNTSIHQ